MPGQANKKDPAAKMGKKEKDKSKRKDLTKIESSHSSLSTTSVDADKRHAIRTDFTPKGPTAAQQLYLDRLSDLDKQESVLKYRAWEGIFTVMNAEKPEFPLRANKPVAQSSIQNASIMTLPPVDPMTQRYTKAEKLLKMNTRRLFESRRDLRYQDRALDRLEDLYLRHERENLIDRLNVDSPSQKDVEKAQAISALLLKRTAYHRRMREEEKKMEALSRAMAQSDGIIFGLHTLNPQSVFRRESEGGKARQAQYMPSLESLLPQYGKTMTGERLDDFRSEDLSDLSDLKVPPFLLSDEVPTKSELEPPANQGIETPEREPAGAVDTPADSKFSVELALPKEPTPTEPVGTEQLEGNKGVEKLTAKPRKKDKPKEAMSDKKSKEENDGALTRGTSHDGPIKDKKKEASKKVKKYQEHEPSTGSKMEEDASNRESPFIEEDTLGQKQTPAHEAGLENRPESPESAQQPLIAVKTDKNDKKGKPTRRDSLDSTGLKSHSFSEGSGASKTKTQAEYMRDHEDSSDSDAFTKKRSPSPARDSFTISKSKRVSLSPPEEILIREPEPTGSDEAAKVLDKPESSQDPVHGSPPPKKERSESKDKSDKPDEDQSGGSKE